MKKILIILTFVFLFTSCSQGVAPPMYAPQPQYYNQYSQYTPQYPAIQAPRSSQRALKATKIKTSKRQIIVKYKNGFGTKSTSFKYKGSQVLDAFNTTDDVTQLHEISTNSNMTTALNAYRKQSRVEFAIPNVSFQVQMDPSAEQPEVESTSEFQSNDPLSSEQWYLNTLKVQEVWDTVGVGHQELKIAVLDTGVDYTHPDLQGKVIKGPDYVDRDNDPLDLHGHGTHVSGIIAAGLNNAEGITGVAPNVKIVAVRVLDENGSGGLYNIAKGIAYAANSGCKVINLSLGSPPGGTFMKSLANFIAWYAERKGSLVIAAAGNNGAEIGFPAAANRFLAVGAVNDKNLLASFSNRGQEMDVVAPGVDIMSTFPTYEVTANKFELPMNYASLNGTSMATPIVSAQAALIWSQNPEWKPEQVREQIENTANDLGEVGIDELYGKGIIDILSSISPDEPTEEQAESPETSDSGETGATAVQPVKKKSVWRRFLDKFKKN